MLKNQVFCKFTPSGLVNSSNLSNDQCHLLQGQAVKTALGPVDPGVLVPEAEGKIILQHVSKYSLVDAT